MKKDPSGINTIINQMDGIKKAMENDHLANTHGLDPSEFQLQSINELIALKLTGVRDVYIRVEEAISRIASLDFSMQIEVDDQKHAGNYIAHSLNMLMEELSSAVFPFQHEVIDSISDLVVVTNQKGLILKANNAFSIATGYSNTELSNKPIYEFMSPSTLNFDLSSGFTLKDIEIGIHGKKRIVPVRLTVSEIKAHKNITQGFTFIAQQVKKE